MQALILLDIFRFLEKIWKSNQILCIATHIRKVNLCSDYHISPGIKLMPRIRRWKHLTFPVLILRGCLKALSWVDGKSPQQELYHGNRNHIFTCANQIFRVFTPSSIPIQPSKCPFNHPSFWDYFKFCHLIPTCHYWSLQPPTSWPPAINLPPYPPSAQINGNPVTVTATFGGTHLAPSGSALSAAWTDRLGINPNLSTRRWSFLAFIFWPAS